MFEDANWVGLFVFVTVVALLWLAGRERHRRMRCVHHAWDLQYKPCRYHHNDGSDRKRSIGPDIPARLG